MLVVARKTGILLLLCVLAACSSRPFEVDGSGRANRLAAQGSITEETLKAYEHDPNPRAVALCYSSQLNTQQEVLERARDLCPNGGAISFFEEDAFFNQCSLFQPFRVTFICTPGPAPKSPYN